VQVNIKSVRVKRRVRKDIGDISGLIESMDRFGQLHPIVLTRNNVLVAGRRRLAAAKSLGWPSIDAVIVRGKDAADLLELELDENVHRTPLTRDEVDEGLLKLERLRHPGFFARIWRAILGFLKKLFGYID
jgi:ParB family chromosome partitioning protein